MTSVYSHSIFESYNARSLKPTEVAKTFVPPEEIFNELSTNNNHIVVGPRGSGKTTLFKMLTIPALSTWEAKDDITYYPKVDFVGVLVPADKGWHAQLDSTIKLGEQGEVIGNAAFATHVLSSFVNCIRDICEYGTAPIVRLENQPVKLSDNEETEFVKIIADAWRLKIDIPSLSGLKLGLRKRLVDLGSLKKELELLPNNKAIDLKDHNYLYLDFKESILYGIEAYEEITKCKNLKWGLLFDEFEIAPSSIQKEVLSNLRGQSDPRLIFKIALAMYNKNVEFMIDDETGASSPGDYQPINLWYPSKLSGIDFSGRIVSRILADFNFREETLKRMLGGSDYFFDYDDAQGAYSDTSTLMESFYRLSSTDRSFKDWLVKQKVDLHDISSLTESERAAKIRKIRSIVITRDYFQNYSSGVADRSIGRSRKIEKIYTGYPTLLAVCEGNPRLTLSIFTPLMVELQRQRQSSNKKSISATDQARQVRSTVNAYRAFLKTIPYTANRSRGARGLLGLLDIIGEYFFRKCVAEEFAPQPPLSFTVDVNTDDSTLTALGRAVNAGAIIYLPDKSADPILSSLKGKRFRLSYLLAAYHKLPLILGGEISLSSILNASDGTGATTQASPQKTLFDSNDSNSDE